MSHAYDVVVVGLGSAGLTAVEIAHQLGLRVAGVERARVGGDCLWTGCVPSKALIASGQVAHTMRNADRWGIQPAEPQIDHAKVWSRIREIQQEIASTDDSAERLRAEGIEVFEGAASLGAANEVRVDGTALRTRFVLLCTGSRPAVPPIPGLEQAGYLTAETLWDAAAPPSSVVIIGGGPVGTELAQALTRIGVPATILEAGPRLLPRDEPEHTDQVRAALRDEGVGTELGVRIGRVESGPDGKSVSGVRADGSPGTWQAAEVIVATGRAPNVEGLGLAAHGIRVGAAGIVADGSGRTAAPWVYVAGDLGGRELFTHAAAAEASRALRTMFFPGSAKGPMTVPWCTFTDPELAHVGLTAEQAGATYGVAAVRVWRRELSRIDRARTDSRTRGSIVIVTAKGRIVGASVLAQGAAELIGELTTAVERGTKLRDLAGVVHVYPAIATGVQQVAGEAALADARSLAPIARLRSRLART